MKKIVWIASYPKCGNTYIRCLLSHYLFNKASEFDFNILKRIPKFETKQVFEKVLDDKISFNNFDYYENFLDVQKKLIKKFAQMDLIFKTHHFFGQFNNHQFTNQETTLLFIYIIRDPREVLVSYAKHSNMLIDEMMEFFVSDQVMRKFKMEAIVNWAIHYRSWKSFKSVPSLFVKFEDLVQNPNKIFREILNLISHYIHIDLDEKLIEKSIQYTQFENLKKLENKFGFTESQENKFFNSGKIDSWKKILNNNQVNTIENKFSKEMIELGYL